MGHKDLGKRNYNPSLAAQNTKEGKAYLSKIRKMEPYERLLYWIKERHSIHCKRFPKEFHAGLALPGLGGKGTPFPKEEPPPWSDDPIFQNVFFCNVYRENDKVTSYLRDNFRQPNRGSPCVMLGCIMLRWYNFIPTMARLINANIPQRQAGKQSRAAIEEARTMLVALRDLDGEQLFGGAYIIRPIVDGKSGARKVESLTELFLKLASDKDLYHDLCSGTMADAFNRLTSFSGMGPFYCYQFIGDLAYTHVLDEASDWFTWSFSGPGTSRGLLRLQHPSGSLTKEDLPRMMKRPKDADDQLLELQENVNRDLGLTASPKGAKLQALTKGGEVRKLQPIHMRDLTNCLCEYDKYERSLFNERSIKRPYRGYA